MVKKKVVRKRSSRTASVRSDHRAREMRLILVLILVGLFLVLTNLYYFGNNEDLGRRGNLVGDGICGNFDDEEGQDFCCSRAHADDVTVQCVGGWQYVSGLQECQYVCSGSVPACGEETMSCNGREVGRSGSECEFEDC